MVGGVLRGRVDDDSAELLHCNDSETRTTNKILLYLGYHTAILLSMHSGFLEAIVRHVTLDEFWKQSVLGVFHTQRDAAACTPRLQYHR